MTNVKDPTQIKLQYEAWWQQTNEALEQVIASGERNMARLVNETYELSVGPTPPGERLSLIFGKEVPAPYLYANRVIRDWIADVIVTAARDGVDAIIETGSGWGYNLFNVFMRGGPRVNYHAFEYTQAGRTCATRLVEATGDDMDLEIHSFNYLSPDLSSIAGRYKKVLLFTSHSIEQIPALPPSFVEEVLNVSPRVHVLHFEPVGWQTAPSGRKPKAPARGMEHAIKHGYNQNLRALLSSFEQSNRIVVDDTIRDVMAVKLSNPTTFLSWRSKDLLCSSPT